MALRGFHSSLLCCQPSAAYVQAATIHPRSTKHVTGPMYHCRPPAVCESRHLTLRSHSGVPHAEFNSCKQASGYLCPLAEPCVTLEASRLIHLRCLWPCSPPGRHEPFSRHVDAPVVRSRWHDKIGTPAGPGPYPGRHVRGQLLPGARPSHASVGEVVLSVLTRPCTSIEEQPAGKTDSPRTEQPCGEVSRSMLSWRLALRLWGNLSEVQSATLNYVLECNRKVGAWMLDRHHTSVIDWQ